MSATRIEVGGRQYGRTKRMVDCLVEAYLAIPQWRRPAVLEVWCLPSKYADHLKRLAFKLHPGVPFAVKVPAKKEKPTEPAAPTCPACGGMMVPERCKMVCTRCSYRET